MSDSGAMKLLTGAIEAILAIPVLGGLIVMASGYRILVVMFILHAVTLFLSVRARESWRGSAAGLAASMLGWIPFLGWALHLATAVLLLMSALRSR